MWRLGCFLLLLTLGLIAFGVQGIYEGVRNRQPSVVTYEQFVKQSPHEGWFEIKNGYLDILDATVETKKSKLDVTGDGKIVQAFVPVHSTNDEKDEETVHLLVATKDPDVLNTMNELAAMDKSNVKDDQVKAWVMKNLSRLIIEKNVKGMLRFGLSAESDVRSQIEAKNKNLASDFVILDEGREPALGASVGAFLLGILLAVGQALYYLGRGRRTA